MQKKIEYNEISTGINIAIDKQIKNFEFLTSAEFLSNFEKFCSVLRETLVAGNKLIYFGNGGSASEANHLATEWIVKFSKKRKSFPAISLNENGSVITATGNDLGFTKIFKRQLESLAKPGDCIIALSTSGQSENILLALKQARKMGIFSVLVTGGIVRSKLSGMTLNLGTTETARIQELSLMINHLSVEIVEKSLQF